jgi:hypothetical protein
LDATSFLKDSVWELFGAACGEPIRAANVLDIAARLTSRTQPPSNATKSPIDRRELEQKRLELEALFIVRFKLLMS